MKHVFQGLWWLFLLFAGLPGLLMVWRSPLDWQPYLFLGVVVHILLCTWHLIREGYRPRSWLGASTTGFWLCLLLLPLNLIPLQAAYATWERGVYVSSGSSGRLRLIGSLLELLQDLFGHWGPIILMLAVGIGGSLLMLRLLLLHRR